MSTLSTNTARTNESTLSAEQAEAPSVVFQPQKLKEVIDLIDLMGKISERGREDNSQDMGGGSSTGSTSSGSTTSTTSSYSTREQLLANLPAPVIMQRKLIEHIEEEMKKIEIQASKLKHSKTPGTAHTLTELFKRIRRLSSIIDEIIHATSEVMKRFFIAVFIDKRPLDVK